MGNQIAGNAERKKYDFLLSVSRSTLPAKIILTPYAKIIFAGSKPLKLGAARVCSSYLFAYFLLFGFETISSVKVLLATEVVPSL